MTNTHPRLCTDAAGITALRCRLQTDKALADRFEAFRAAAEPLMTQAFFRRNMPIRSIPSTGATMSWGIR